MYLSIAMSNRWSIETWVMDTTVQIAKPQNSIDIQPVFFPVDNSTSKIFIFLAYKFVYRALKQI